MSRHDYGLAERAMAFWCPLTLTLLAVTSLGLRYVTDPISCWTPAQFTGAHVDYANNYCFQQQYFYSLLSTADYIPMDMLRPHMQFTYHQWVSFVLGALAVLCLLPHVLWRLLGSLLWLDTHTLAQALGDNQRQSGAGRHAMLWDCALMLQAGLRAGSWALTAAALVRKVVCLVTCVVVVVMTGRLFQPHFTAASRGDPTSLNITVPFPEATLCDVSIRRIQNVDRYTLQCVFPLSQVYSKGFTFLFYLFVLLAIICLLDILTSIARLAIPGLRDLHLKRFVAAVEGSQASPVATRFLDSLGLDGRLVLAVVADTCGPLAASDLTGHMWTAFKRTPLPGVASAPAASTVPAPTTMGASGAPGQASGATGQGPVYPHLATGGRGPEAYPLLPVSGQEGGTAPAKC